MSGTRALRLEHAGTLAWVGMSVNVVGGYSGNSVAAGAIGATVAGGGYHRYLAGHWIESPNTVQTNYGAIGGGFKNEVGGVAGTISGGSGNRIQSGADDSNIAGGLENFIETNSINSSIGGGCSNVVEGSYNTIGAGMQNSVFGVSYYSPATYSTIGGGHSNRIYLCSNAVINGGSFNHIESDPLSGTSAHYSVIGGGSQNSVYSTYAALAGGQGNVIGWGAIGAAIGGGWNNQINANARYSSIPGGTGNQASGYGSFAAGMEAHALHGACFVWNGGGTHELETTGTGQFLAQARWRSEIPV